MVKITFGATSNKSLQLAGGRWYLVASSTVTIMDKLPMLGLGEPPGAELSR
jgi:hypothetical protein